MKPASQARTTLPRRRAPFSPYDSRAGNSDYRMFGTTCRQDQSAVGNFAAALLNTLELLLTPSMHAAAAAHDVDGDDVPVRHFGVISNMDAWHALAERLRNAGTRFVIEPHVRFKGQPGEQATMFLLDPSGNALELNAFADRGKLFAE